jgi:hydroxymethylpyrimidine pyrophosphatase-like HAD family hydrolase
LGDLSSVFSRIDLFDRVVAENGAVLCRPADSEERLMAKPPPECLIQMLRKRGVHPLELGHVIIRTRQPHASAALESIRDLGLDHQIIFNGPTVMVLPSGINKAIGLAAALQELELSPHNVVGIGNAENDHSFLKLIECSVAVGDAIPAIRARAAFSTKEEGPDGVVALIDEIINSDLKARKAVLGRHRLLLGTSEESGSPAFIPKESNLLKADLSASGRYSS